MDVSSFLGGNFLAQLDLPAQPVVWRITDVKQQLVGTDTKIVVYFTEHPKGLGLNKTNLRAIATTYGVQAQGWIGKPLELFRDVTQFQGRSTPCIRVRIPQPQFVQPQFVQPPMQPAIPQLQPAAAPAYQPAPQPAPAPPYAQPVYQQPQAPAPAYPQAPPQPAAVPQQFVQPAAAQQQAPAPWEQEAGERF